MVQMQDYKTDETLRRIIEQERREQEQEAAIHAQKAQARDEYRARTIPATLSADQRAAVLRGDDVMATLCATPERELAQNMRTLDADEAEANFRLAKRPNSIVTRDLLSEKLQPLREQVTEARERLTVCRVAGRELIEAVLNEAITTQVKQRDAVLAKAVPFEDEIRRLETLKQQAGIGCMASRTLGIARLLAHE